MSKPTIPSTDTPPFSLPLSVREFERALSIGHGRAWLHASRHGVDGLHDVITHALLHSLAFDVQCEGDRGPWMMAIVDAANAGDLFYPKIIERVHEPPEGDYAYWHIHQRAPLWGRWRSVCLGPLEPPWTSCSPSIGRNNPTSYSGDRQSSTSMASKASCGSAPC